MSGIPPSSVAKFNWAHQHFQRLQAEVKTFFAPKPYEVRADPNADQTEYRFYLDFTTPIPAERWGLMFGDGVHCLRSALDHCVYAIGVKESGRDPPPQFRRLQFLITENEDRWDESVWQIKTLSGPVVAAIKVLQEHGNPEEFGLRPLGALQEFDNADKHRQIHVTAIVPTFGDLNLAGLIGGQQASINFRVAPIEPDTPFASLTLDRPTANVKVRDNLVLEVGLPRFRQDGHQTTVLVWRSVDTMSQAVTHDLNVLAPFC